MESGAYKPHGSKQTKTGMSGNHFQSITQITKVDSHKDDHPKQGQHHVGRVDVEAAGAARLLVREVVFKNFVPEFLISIWN